MSISVEKFNKLGISLEDKSSFPPEIQELFKAKSISQLKIQTLNCLESFGQIGATIDELLLKLWIDNKLIVKKGTATSNVRSLIKDGLIEKAGSFAYRKK